MGESDFTTIVTRRCNYQQLRTTNNESNLTKTWSELNDRWLENGGRTAVSTFGPKWLRRILRKTKKARGPLELFLNFFQQCLRRWGLWFLFISVWVQLEPKRNGESALQMSLTQISQPHFTQDNDKTQTASKIKSEWQTTSSDSTCPLGCRLSIVLAFDNVTETPRAH